MSDVKISNAYVGVMNTSDLLSHCDCDVCAHGREIECIKCKCSCCYKFHIRARNEINSRNDI